TMRQFLGGNWNTIPHIVIGQAVLAVAAAVGALVPDLDQPDSLMSHEFGFLARIPVFAMLAGLVVALHKQTSVTAWVLMVVLAYVISAQKNFSRIMGLVIAGTGIVYLGSAAAIPLTASLSLAVWIMGAIFTKHRTFTHSIIGFALYAFGVEQSMHGLKHIHLGMAVAGLILGYALHLAADIISGGVPLMWPWERRWGVRLVTTGGLLDRWIGKVALLGFVALSVI
ncbi:MAG: metal-dependent hydrolase, partial [Alicyclobacillus sp.]|nr:metal-dependent hydrolase [Alicyclobacillus sp.]